MPHAFVSYLHEDSPIVERLLDDLRRAGVEIWFDRESLRAGSRWAETIETAIESGGFFVACFSRAYARCEQTHLHEELTVARRTLRTRARERAWLIPVLIDGCSPQKVGLVGHDARRRRARLRCSHRRLGQRLCRRLAAPLPRADRVRRKAASWRERHVAHLDRP